MIGQLSKLNLVLSVSYAYTVGAVGLGVGGSLVQVPMGPSMENGLVAGELPVHILSTSEVPLSKAPNRQSVLGATALQQTPHSP